MASKAKNKNKKKMKKKKKRKKQSDFDKFLDLFFAIFVEYLPVYSLSNLCFLHPKSAKLVNTKIAQMGLNELYKKKVNRIQYCKWLRISYGNPEKILFKEGEICNFKLSNITKTILQQIPKKGIGHFVTQKLKIPNSAAKYNKIYAGVAQLKSNKNVSAPSSLILHKQNDIKSANGLLQFIIKRLKIMRTYHDIPDDIPDDVSLDKLKNEIVAKMDEISLQQLKKKKYSGDMEVAETYSYLLSFMLLPHLFAKISARFSIYSCTLQTASEDDGYFNVAKIDTWLNFIIVPERKASKQLKIFIIKMHFIDPESDGA